MIMAGNERLLLDNPDRGFLLKEGSASVYAVRYDRQTGQPVGKQHYLFSCYRNCLLWGIPFEAQVARDETSVELWQDDYVMLVMPQEGADMEAVESSALLANDTPALLAAMDEWCQRVGRYMGNLVKDSFVEKMPIDQDIQLSDGQWFRPDGRGLFLVNVREGTVFAGSELHDVNFPGGGAPLLYYGFTTLVFRCEGQTALRFDTVAGIDRNVLAGLKHLAQLVLNRFIQLESEQQAEEVQRLENQSRINETAGEQVLSYLDIENEPVISDQDTDLPTVRVMRVIANNGHLAFDFSLPLSPDDSSESQMDRICRYSSIRFREVTLMGTWWLNDSGPLFAFREDSGKPVALLNVPRMGGLSRRYEIFDPETGVQTPLSEAELDSLSTKAYSFTRPMPDDGRMLDFMALMKFIAPPFMIDARLLIGVSLLASAIGLMVPIASKMIMDDVIPEANRSLMADLGGGLVFMALATLFFSLSKGVIVTRLKTAMGTFAQSMIMDRALRLPSSFMRGYDVGDFQNRLMMINEITTGLSFASVNLFFSLLTVLLQLAMSFYFNAKLALIGLVSAFFITGISMAFARVVKRLSLIEEVEEGKLVGYLTQLVHGVSKLQMANARQRAFREWSKLFGKKLRRRYRIEKLEHYSAVVNAGLQTISVAALFLVAGKMVSKAAAAGPALAAAPTATALAASLLTVGTFFAVQGAINQVTEGLEQFFSGFLNIHQLLAKRELVRPLLEAPLEKNPDATRIESLEGRIEFRNVAFRYDENLPWIFRNLSLEISPGEFVALVGPSGCGKSTIVRLLLGMERIESGQILIDQMDTDSLDMDSVRQQCGVVIQNSRISAGSILTNITSGTPMSMDNVWQAAEDAGIAEDIRDMPMGMHTVMTEGGTTLSGGQRQRILIAKAMARNPTVVIFDEATSALDNKTQHTVTEALKVGKVTRIVVAHRLSTIIDADKILVIDQGKVVESGNYHSLMAQDGLFKRLAERQQT